MSFLVTLAQSTTHDNHDGVAMLAAVALIALMYFHPDFNDE